MFELLLGSNGNTGKAWPEFRIIQKEDFLTGQELNTLATVTTRFPSAVPTKYIDELEWFYLRDPERGKIVMIPSRATCNTLSWNQANGIPPAGVEIPVKGMIWKYTLFTGRPGNVLDDWDRYMHYGLYAGANNNATFPKKWAALTKEQLGYIQSSPSRDGLATPCRPQQQSGFSFVRGNTDGPGYSNGNGNNATNTWSSSGFRPILTYVSGDIPWEIED